MEGETVLCSGCGWAGSIDELVEDDDSTVCPACGTTIDHTR